MEPQHDKTNKMATQSDQSSMSAWRSIGSLTTHKTYSEYSQDQTGQMPRLVESLFHFVGFAILQLNYKAIEMTLLIAC